MIYSSSLVSGCQAAKSDAVDGRLVISGGDGQLAQMLDLETKVCLSSASPELLAENALDC